VFYTALNQPGIDQAMLEKNVLAVSRIASIFLIISYVIYVFFQMRTHHGIYDAILETDEQQNVGRAHELHKPKLTFTECVCALTVSITLVTIIAIALVDEHLTAIDEAWDNQMNFALSHVLGATVQTALFNAPLVVLVGWGLNKPMDLNFDVFNIVVLILSIIVVGNFLRDQKSNYLEGSLCLIVYIIIAVAAYYYPNQLPATTLASEERFPLTASH
jgi:Ca2+:H+ antiporter